MGGRVQQTAWSPVRQPGNRGTRAEPSQRPASIGQMAAEAGVAAIEACPNPKLRLAVCGNINRESGRRIETYAFLFMGYHQAMVTFGLSTHRG